jgi:hypothetical protein
MAIHKPGHQHGAAAIDDFIAGLRPHIGTDADHRPIGNAQIAGLNPRWIELNEQCVAKESRHENFEQKETEETEMFDRFPFSVFSVSSCSKN